MNDLTATQINEIANTVYEQANVLRDVRRGAEYGSAERFEADVKYETTMLQYYKLRSAYYAKEAEDCEDDPYWEMQSKIAKLEAEKFELEAEYSHFRMREAKAEAKEKAKAEV